METLHTARLLLRPWEISDAEALYTQAHNPIIGKMCGWPPHKSVEESREIIEVVLSKPHSFAICLANNIPIGSIGLLLQGESNLPISESEAEIGYWLGEDFWGKGYVTEATLRVIHMLLNSCTLPSYGQAHTRKILPHSEYLKNVASVTIIPLKISCFRL